MHHLTFGINSLLHSVNLVVFTLLLVHLILRTSPNHSHRLRSHHILSLPQPFTPELKLISFTNPFLHSHSYSFRTAVRILTWGAIHERSQTAVARATSANVIANDFATSHVIHETNRTCEHRKFGRKLTQNLRRTFRCRE